LLAAKHVLRHVLGPSGFIGGRQEARQEPEDERLDFSEPSAPRGRGRGRGGWRGRDRGRPVPRAVLASLVLLLGRLVAVYGRSGTFDTRITTTTTITITLDALGIRRLAALEDPSQEAMAQLRRAQVEQQPDQTETQHTRRRTVLIEDESSHGELEDHAQVDVDPYLEVSPVVVSVLVVVGSNGVVGHVGHVGKIWAIDDDVVIFVGHVGTVPAVVVVIVVLIVVAPLHGAKDGPQVRSETLWCVLRP